MKEFNNYTCRTHSVLSKQLQMLWRTAMVVAAVFLLSPGALAQGDAPDLPDPDRCVAQDLIATEARLTGDSPCYTCEEGNEMLSTLELTINNKTGSVRTSVAFWATLVITDSDGNVTESYINGCTGPLSGKEYETFGFGDVSYECGDALVLKNIYLAWTDASDGDRNQCPLDPSKIAPKCKAQGDLVIIPPLSARVEAFVQPCVGETNGSITVFAQGGTGESYTYTLNPGNITNSTGVFTNLGEGTYTIRVEDAEECFTEIEYVLEDQVCCVPPTVTAQPDDESVCEGEAASFTVAYTGGEPAPTIQWQVSTDGTTWEDITDGGAYSGATTATLSISATTEAMNGNWYRAALTSGTCETVYTEPAELEVNEIPDAPVSGGNQEVCAADPIQTLTATATAPEGITIVWYDAATGGNIVASPTLNTVGSVTYYAQAESEAGCISAARTAVTLIINETPAAPVVKNDEFCATTGTITLADYIEADGDVIFTNSEGIELEVQPTTLSRATAGVFTYYVVQVEGDCVSEMASFTITINENPVAPTVTVTHPTCAAAGSITVTAPLGDDLEYSINDGDDWQAEVLFADLAPGTYTVWVRNAAGCMAESDKVTVNPVPDAPAAPVVHVRQPACTDATATITITSSTEGLMFSVNEGEFVAYPAGGWVVTTAGEYSIVARNAAMCVSGAARVRVNSQPFVPDAPVSGGNQVACVTDNMPLLTATATVPEGIRITWYTAAVGGSLVTSPTLNRVGTVTYYAEANYGKGEPDAGCPSRTRTAVTLTILERPAAPTVRATHPSCTMATGTITVTAPLGEGMMYSLNGGAYQASVTFNGLASGNYTLTARNAAGCISGSTAVTINNAPSAPAAPTATVTQPTCLMPMGMITVTAPTGEGMMYSLNGGAYQSSTSFGDLMPGTYTLTVRNAAGCVSAGTTVVVNDQPNAPTPIVRCETSGFSYEDHKKGLVTVMHTSYGPVGVTARKRNPDGTYAMGNYAALFDTQAPTGDDTDLYTTDWGLAMIINQDQTNVPNDNQWGGEMIFNFAAIGPVTMQSLKALDIDNYENMSWIYLYDEAGNELYKVELQNLGNNSKQVVDLGNTSGVITMKVVLDGRNESGHLAGSGAIDEIEFCVEEAGSNCETVGFPYADHDAGLITLFHTPFGDVNVTGRKRNADGSFAAGNYAALFDTQAPTGDDTDLYTTDWGLALIINQDQTNVPNDNQHGGELMIDFSNIGPVTMESLKALDIDIYSNNAWVYLYDAEGNELYKVKLQNLGDNTKQDVDLGSTKGVMSMRVVFDGRDALGNLTGSGAIDEIRFCVESPCVDVAMDNDDSNEVEAVSIMDAKAYPTPFNDKTTIEFRTRNTEDYVVNLYDTRGSLIKQLKTGTAVAGELNKVEVEGRELAEGMYMARIVSGSGAKTVKLILKK